MTLRLRIAIGAFMALAVALPAAAAPDGAVNACGLLTRDEATAAVGSPAGEGKLTAGQSMSKAGIEVSGCNYTGGSKDLSVSLWRFGPSAQQSLEIYRGLCKKKEQAPGLGDQACWYNASHNELQVLKGSSLIIVQLRGRTAEALTTVAKQALGRLK
jgi:hypothetical protein